ncbi:CaiB/BaiF CoA transferase family protein [Alterisphingorhabdus coralli]|uniref:CaiB/BaiF CoA-transferase family protein n=1 Tax=Alterisphingorhabdus coralli TaxID=3071408 RepID=A0AA97FA52_9SPHN|nr:CaiB/BaiF CoA-transferase family protein [Parasphingorhabdus sp. SCSIO 66989]WOE76072.1 CaiB/BaiF CoA-transferase family protein [Parasphingorhabdus sp. SCSIO 66989]
MPGVLDGVTIIELAGIGPGPFAGMMLADHGARVIRVERPGAQQTKDILNRSRELVTADLKSEEGVAKVRDLAREADGLIEGFRPGVMERLGLGPDLLHADNPALVYGRMTGWGQTGPYAPFAGHDINYIALSGALHGYGRAGDKPTPPINAVGDFGGGGMMMAFGMVAGILSARQTGKGQVIDCAMTDGSAVLSAMTYTFLGNGQWRDERGVNLLDTGAHFYDTYETADGKYVSIGSIEAQFYAELRKRAGLAEDADFDPQMNPAEWPKLKEKLTTIFKSKTRDEWCALLEHSDACFAPVLSLSEAPNHPHNAERQTYIKVDGMVQPAPAPRFSETPAPKPRM